MPTPKLDDDPIENHQNCEPQLEPKAPLPKRRGAWVWVVLMVLLLLVLGGALVLSARAQFDRNYENALNNILLQQGMVVATLGAGK